VKSVMVKLVVCACAGRPAANIAATEQLANSTRRANAIAQFPQPCPRRQRQGQ
jgi:hypothetical protein